jgi:pimeloyl-ACP methyl ester carboxylesterase
MTDRAMTACAPCVLPSRQFDNSPRTTETCHGQDASEKINHYRRHFFSTAALTIAAAQLGVIGAAQAQSDDPKSAPLPAIKAGTNTSFAPLKQIDAGTLNVGYAEAGPADGPPVILLHGWPYDIHSFVDVAPLLAGAGYRVIVPYLRGYGTTRFLSSDTPRNGQQSVVAVDAIALMDALKIEKATIGGFDWGARTANIVGALWPERCKAMVSVSGYLIGSREAGKVPLPPQAELQWWYQYYFATERGRDGYDKYRRDFSKLIWQLASPKWNFDDATFARSAASFDNPDHVSVVIHNYRWRLGLAEGEPKYDDLEQRLAKAPVITVPTITLEGDANGAPHPDPPPLMPRCSPANTSTGRSPAASGPAGLCPSHRRYRPSLIGAGSFPGASLAKHERTHHEMVHNPGARPGRRAGISQGLSDAANLDSYGDEVSGTEVTRCFRNMRNSRTDPSFTLSCQVI